jgi:hypothetical protein
MLGCDAVIQLTGLSGFFIGYIIPGFLQHYAIKVRLAIDTSCVQRVVGDTARDATCAQACRDKWGSAGERTPFTGHFSRPVYIWTIVAVVFLGFAFTAIELLFGARFGF